MLRKGFNYLEGARHAEAANFMRQHPRDIVAVEEDLPGTWDDQTGDGVEGCRFSRPVGADQTSNLARIDLQTDVVDSHQVAKIYGEVSYLELWRMIHVCDLLMT